MTGARTAGRGRASRAPPDRPVDRPGGLLARQAVPQAPGAARCQPQAGTGRGGGSARPERRWQDHLVLHPDRADPARFRRRRAGRQRYHPAADVPPGTDRHRLPAAGSLDLPRHDGGKQYSRRAGGYRTRARTPGEPPGSASRRVLDHPSQAHPGAGAFPAANGAGSRSRGRSHARRTTSCSTSRSSASIPSR